MLHRCLDQAAVTGWVVRTNPFEGGSDHVPFLDAKKPGLLFWHFTDVFYHTDNDRLPNVSPRELANVGVSALVSALTLASADGATARALVAEVQQAAAARLDARGGAVAGGGCGAAATRERERLILDTWTDWYRGAIRSMAEIEVGGSSRRDQAGDRCRRGGGAARGRRRVGRAPLARPGVLASITPGPTYIDASALASIVPGTHGSQQQTHRRQLLAGLAHSRSSITAPRGRLVRHGGPDP